MNPTNDPQDDDLRDLLRAAGREGRRRAPSFQHVWRGVQERRTPAPVWRWWPAWGLGAAAAVCAVLLLNRPSVPVPPADEPMPTDFLLVADENARAGRVADEITALLQPDR
jgi:hypothetical protein